MAKLKISDRQVQALPVESKPKEYGFGDGLQIRVYPDGRKVARFRYKFLGKSRILTLGDYGRGSGQFTLAQLLKKHAAMKGKLASNEDPAQIRDDEREAIKLHRLEKDARLSLKDVARVFMDKYQGSRGRIIADKTRNEYRKHLENIVISKWGGYEIEALPTKKILSDMQKMPKVQANRLFTTMNLLFKWATNEGMMDANPLAGRNKPGGIEVSKERALDYDAEMERIVDKGEIKTLWNGLEDINPLFKHAVRMILLTGQRPGEVLSAKWSHFNDEEWTIPAATTKNKKGVHRIPMTPKLAALLDDIRCVSDGSEWLFPDRSGRNCMKPNSLAQRLLKCLNDEDHVLHGLQPFTAHDLRRTVATQLKGLDYLKAEIGLLLNHSTSDVTDIYARGKSMKRLRTMLESWHRRLDSILEGTQVDNLVEMRR